MQITNILLTLSRCAILNFRCVEHAYAIYINALLFIYTYSNKQKKMHIIMHTYSKHARKNSLIVIYSFLYFSK